MPGAEALPRFHIQAGDVPLTPYLSLRHAKCSLRPDSAFLSLVARNGRSASDRRTTSERLGLC